MNKMVATTLEAKFHLYDLRTHHPQKGFTSLAEKVWDTVHNTLNIYKMVYLKVLIVSVVLLVINYISCGKFLYLTLAVYIELCYHSYRVILIMPLLTQLHLPSQN